MVVNGTFNAAAFKIVTDEDHFANPISGGFSVEFRDTNGDNVLDSLFLVYTADPLGGE